MKQSNLAPFSPECAPLDLSAYTVEALTLEEIEIHHIPYNEEGESFEFGLIKLGD